jgi:DNA-binding response OmpR family regulator
VLADYLTVVNFVPPAMNRAIRVIVGEDDANDRFFLQRAFEKYWPDVTVEFARSGEEVLRCLEDTSRAAPALLILDSMMSKMSGFDVLKWLRAKKEFVELPVVMLSGQLSEANAKRAAEFGVKEYLAKPNDMSGLRALVDDLRRKYLQANQ